MKINPPFSSHISVEASHGDSKQCRVRAAQSALLTNTSIASHIIVRESITMPVDIGRVHQSRVMLERTRQYLVPLTTSRIGQLTFVTGFW